MNRTDDECYTGTGPAAEVAGSFWSTLPRATSALHSKSEEGQPTYTELLAQRDELAKALKPFAEYDLCAQGIHQRFAEHVLKARIALSRIKGA